MALNHLGNSVRYEVFIDVKGLASDAFAGPTNVSRHPPAFQHDQCIQGPPAPPLRPETVARCVFLFQVISRVSTVFMETGVATHRVFSDEREHGK